MDVEFDDVDGVKLRGRILLPSSGSHPAPTLIMAHGFSLTWRQGLMPFARACQKSGIAVLLFDHRALGESDGEPRGAIGWWTQLRGYKQALDFLSTADLNGAVGRLQAFDSPSGRWAVALDGAASVRIKPINLTPVTPAAESGEASSSPQRCAVGLASACGSEHALVLCASLPSAR